MYAKPKALLPINLNKKNLPAHTNVPKGIRILLRIDSLFTDPLFSVTKSVRQRKEVVVGEEENSLYF